MPPRRVKKKNQKNMDHYHFPFQKTKRTSRSTPFQRNSSQSPFFTLSLSHLSFGLPPFLDYPLFLPHHGRVAALRASRLHRADLGPWINSGKAPTSFNSGASSLDAATAVSADSNRPFHDKER